MERTADHKDPTDLVTLRPFNPSDLDAFYLWASDDEVSRFCRWETYTTKADLLLYINTVVLHHPWFRAICLADGHPIGAISLTPVAGSDPHRAELRYVLAREHWGKGIATEVVRKAMRVAAEEMAGVERVEAVVIVENVASQKVLEKAGFVTEGVTRRYAKGREWDVVIYSWLPSSDGITKRIVRSD